MSRPSVIGVDQVRQAQLAQRPIVALESPRMQLAGDSYPAPRREGTAHEAAQPLVTLADRLELFTLGIAAAALDGVPTKRHQVATFPIPDGFGAVDYYRVCSCGWFASYVSAAAADIETCSVLMAERERSSRASRDGARVMAAIRSLRQWHGGHGSNPSHTRTSEIAHESSDEGAVGK